MDAREVVFLSKYLIKPKNLVHLRSLMRAQQLPPDEIRTLNFQKRLRLLEYAYSRVPYYTHVFRDSGIHPSDIRTPDDWQHVPLLTRRDVQQNFDALTCPDLAERTHVMASTGGTTGIPLKVYGDRRVPSETPKWRMMKWTNVPLGANEACISRPPRNALRRLDWLKVFPSRLIILDTSSMSADSVRDFVVNFNTIRPLLIRGYPNAISHLSTMLDDMGLRPHPPNAIWVTSSPVTGVQRETIERVFRAPVYDQYGSCEVRWIAQECKVREGLHINSDLVHVEFLDASGKPCTAGDEGQLAVTDLDNYAFPIIRYLNGDLGRELSTSCSCGIGFPLMAAVKGRVSDAVWLPDGSMITGEYLTTLFDPFPSAVKQFQILQKKDYSVELVVVPNPASGDSDAGIESVHRLLQEKVGGQVRVEVRQQATIDLDLRKSRYVLSEARRPPGAHRESKASR